MDKKRIRKAAMILLALAFLFSAGMMVRQEMIYRRIGESNREAALVAGLSGDAEHGVQERPSVEVMYHDAAGPDHAGSWLRPEPLPEELAYLADIDLAALREVNPDVIGWIMIPDTELSYPLLQGEDNQHYLSHDWTGAPSGGGSVFLESSNGPDLSGFHTIAYAHRMRNGSMFGTLKYYAGQEYLDAHPHVYIVLDGMAYGYDLFSAHEAAVEGPVYRLDLEERGLEKAFIAFCVDESVVASDIRPEPGDRLLTMSTCTGNGHENRFVVHGVLSHLYELRAGMENPEN